MGSNVITVARTLGAGGEELGQALAKDLGYRYVDSEIITLAAEKAGASEAVVAKAEGRKGIMARILDSLATVPLQTGTGDVYFTPAPNEGFEQLIVEVIREVAAQGKVVLVAHGAAFALGAQEGVFRVLVTASEAARATRLAAGGAAQAAATKQVADSDKSRQEFLQRFYHVNRELPTHYDLVVNTDLISIAQAEAGILAMVRA